MKLNFQMKFSQSTTSSLLKLMIMTTTIEMMTITMIYITDLISACQSDMHQTVEVGQVLLRERHILPANCHCTHQLVREQTATLKFIVH